MIFKAKPAGPDTWTVTFFDYSSPEVEVKVRRNAGEWEVIGEGLSATEESMALSIAILDATGRLPSRKRLARLRASAA